MALGDTSNDNGMLEESGVAVVLKNGTEDTLALADYVTELDCDHEGAAHFLREYFNI